MSVSGTSRFALSILLVLLAFFLTPIVTSSVVQAADYYVDTDSLGGTCGDDQAGSITEPFCTASAAAAIADAGDTVYFRQGTYHETLTPVNAGTADNRIVYRAYQDETPIISGADALSGWVSLGDQESGGLLVTGFESGSLDDFDSTTAYAGSTSETGGLFTEGFEDNTLSNFNSTTADGANTVLVQTDEVGHGTYAVEMTYDGTNENARLNKTLMTSDDVSVRFYFRIAEDFDLVGTSQTHDLVRLRLSTTGNRVKAGISKNADGDFSLVSQIETPSSSTLYAGSPGEIVPGQWHLVELRYKGGDASTGGAELWLDGNSLASNYGLNTSTLQVSRVEIGGNSSGATQPTAGSQIQIDSIKVDTVSPIGEFEVQNTDNTVELTSEVSLHGSASLINTYGGVGQNARANKNISTTADAYGRVYFRFNQDFGLSEPDKPHTIFMLRQGVSGNLVKASIQRNADGDFALTALLEAPSEQTIYAGSPGELVADTWYSLELRYKGGDALTGGAEVWLDGVSMGSNYTLDTSTYAVDRIETGGNSSGDTFPTAGSELYFDDLKADDEFIGEFVPEGDAYIYKVGGINWTPTDVYQNLSSLTEVEALEDLDDPGQWYVDTDTDYIYVHTTTSTDPDNYVIDVTRRSRVVEISALSYITVQNLIIQHSRQTGEAGVYLANSEGIEIRDNTIRQNTGSGVRMVTTTNSLIANNTFSANIREFGGAIRLEQGSNDNTLRANTITGIGILGGNGMFFCGDVVCNSVGNSGNIIERNIITNVRDSCMYLDRDNDDNIIRQNFCSGSVRRSESSGGNGIHIALGSDNNVVFSNIVAGVERHGISVRAGNESQGFIPNIGTKIINNTVYQAGTDSGNGLNLQAGNEQTLIRNNIVHTAADAALNIDPESVGDVDSAYNLLYNPDGNVASWNSQTFTSLKSYQQASDLDGHSISRDPKFSDAESDEFGLRFSSPAINAGIYLSDFHDGAVDYSLAARIKGPAVDLGALESATWPVISSFTSSNSSSSDSSECSATKPSNVPQLFQLTASDGAISLAFVPAGAPITSYMIAYQDMSTGVEYAALLPSSGQTSGVEQMAVASLRPNTTYRLRVQGLHHCAVSGWSNEMEISTTQPGAKLNVQYLYGPVQSLLRRSPLRFLAVGGQDVPPSQPAVMPPSPAPAGQPTDSVVSEDNPSSLPSPLPQPTSEVSLSWWQRLVARLRDLF